MVQINVSNPYLQLSTKDTFAILVDIVPEKGQSIPTGTVIASNQDLSFEQTQLTTNGTTKPNGEIRLQFWISGNYNPQPDENSEQDFPINVEFIGEDGSHLAETKYPLKLKIT